MSKFWSESSSISLLCVLEQERPWHDWTNVQDHLSLSCWLVAKGTKISWTGSGLQIRVRTGKLFFLISQPKHMLWVLKRTVSIRRFF